MPKLTEEEIRKQFEVWPLAAVRMCQGRIAELEAENERLRKQVESHRAALEELNYGVCCMKKAKAAGLDCACYCAEEIAREELAKEFK